MRNAFNRGMKRNEGDKNKYLQVSKRIICHFFLCYCRMNGEVITDNIAFAKSNYGPSSDRNNFQSINHF